MRTCLVVIAILFLCASLVMAEEAIGIPVYPGGESTMEISLADADLLPTLKAMLPMMKLGGLEKIDPNDLEAALKDVKLVEVLQVEVRTPASEAQIADFYSQKAPAGTWNQVFKQSTTKTAMALFVQGAGEKLYGYRVQTAVEDTKPIKNPIIFRTEGKIDYVKALTIAGKMLLNK
jgi:hypothetical protein